MPIELPLFGTLTGGLVLFFKIGFIVLAILYFIFSLIVIRQVALMSQTVITEGGFVLRAISIIHAGLALGVVVFFIWML